MSWKWWFGDGDGGVRLWYGSSGGDEDGDKGLLVAVGMEAAAVGSPEVGRSRGRRRRRWEERRRKDGARVINEMGSLVA
ncbi:hypothetical protein Tco_1304246 [Tanacetum coccineum]